MTVNKNFVIRNGLEVSSDLIIADADLNNVGIGSTIPNHKLSVNGSILADNLNITGVSTFSSDVDINASIDIQNDATIGGGLTVTGISTFASDLDINASVDIQNNTTIGGGLTVTGVSTFTDIDVNGTITVSDTTGSSGQYLQSTGTGVTWASFPSNTVETVTQTATESQTTFTGLDYTVGYIDVYLNGVRLSPSEFTATNETDVVLDDGAFEGDTLDFVIFRKFELESNVFTSLTVNGGISIGGEVLGNVNITAGTLLANQDIDLADGMVHYFTTNETGIATANIRIGVSTSLDSRMKIGDTAAVNILITPNAAGYSTCINIDGSFNDVKWLNGSTPSSGSASGIDSYNYQIIKTASSTFTVLGFVDNFA